MSPSPSSSCRCVLVVDDDADIRDGLAELLDAEGYCTVLCENGREALDYLAAHPAPCVVLLDLMMPVMSGREFRVAQLSNPAMAAIPVVVISAGDNAIEQARALGAECIPKPLDLSRLFQTLEARCPPSIPAS